MCSLFRRKQPTPELCSTRYLQSGAGVHEYLRDLEAAVLLSPQAAFLPMRCCDWAEIIFQLEGASVSESTDQSTAEEQQKPVEPGWPSTCVASQSVIDAMPNAKTSEDA